MSVRHITSIESDEESFQRGGASRTAVCTCGWRGSQRSTLELVVDDACEHERLSRLPPVMQKLVWHQRPDGLWNAPCACSASIVGIQFERRAEAEEEHFTVAHEERERRHARHPGTPMEIPPCGPKLPEATQYIPTLVFP
jgi:hypothetical protein